MSHESRVMGHDQFILMSTQHQKTPSHTHCVWSGERVCVCVCACVFACACVRGVLYLSYSDIVSL